MEQTIWKYGLLVADGQKILMPLGTQILTVQMQNGVPHLWALVNTNATLNEHRYIEIIGTGNPMSPAQRKYIGTFQMIGGSLVYHVFERLSNL